MEVWSALGDPVIGVLVSLGVGILIGIERERRKGDADERAAAGVRSFTLAALLGTLARLFGGDAIFAATLLGTAALVTASYVRDRERDPGLTTEIALLVTVLLGGLALERPTLAGALGVVVAALLAIRTPLHRFIREALTREELRDALGLAIATFGIWPLLPTSAVGPFGALNLHAIWLVVILVMAIGAMGHIVVRIVGARLGIPLTGFFSGFISSTAAIAALANRAAHEPEQRDAAVAGAVLSSVATLMQLSVLLAAINPAILIALAPPLLGAGATAVVFGAYFLAIALKTPGASSGRSRGAFSVLGALTFGVLICVVLVTSAAFDAWFGSRGVLASTAIAGLVDVHAASISAATLAKTGALRAADAALAIVIGLSANTVSKIAMAFSAGGGAFATRVTAGLVLTAAAAWIGLALAKV